MTKTTAATNTCYELAKKAVQDYCSEYDSLLRDRDTAIDAYKFQEVLKSGIDAYHWLCQADKFLREADYRGIAEYTQDLQDAIEGLFKAWMQPCATAEQRISEVENEGYAIDNLQDFRNVCGDVEDRLEKIEWMRITSAAREKAWNDETDD